MSVLSILVLLGVLFGVVLPAWALGVATGRKWVGMVWVALVLSLLFYHVGTYLDEKNRWGTPPDISEEMAVVGPLGELSLNRVQILFDETSNNNQVVFSVVNSCSDEIELTLTSHQDGGESRGLSPGMTYQDLTAKVPPSSSGEITFDCIGVGFLGNGSIDLKLKRTDEPADMFSKTFLVHTNGGGR